MAEMNQDLRLTVRLVMALGLVAIVAPGLSAQSPGLREAHPRAEVGGGVSLAFPVGEFGNFVDFGGGLNGFAVINLDRAALLGLRIEGSFMLYGSETVQRPLSLTIPEVAVDVTTDNFIVSFGVGPQFTLSHGPVRPYVFGTLGFSYFATESSARGTADDYPFGRSVNFDDFTFAIASGAGLLVNLSSGRKPVALDLGVEFLQNGRTRYLREGSMRAARDGTVTFTPIESETNMLVVRFGVSVGLF
jgi:hypothetical protein